MKLQYQRVSKRKTLLAMFLVVTLAAFGSFTLYGALGFDFRNKYFSVLNPLLSLSGATDVSDLWSKLDDVVDTSDGELFTVLEAMIKDGYSPELLSIESPHIGLLLSLTTGNQKRPRYSSAPKGTTTANAMTSREGVSTLSSTSKNNSLTPINSKTTLSKRLTTTSTPVNRVPNVVHYVLIGQDLKFLFTHYLSFRSVERFIKPDQIFIHGDFIPSGEWWNRTILEVKNIYHVNTSYSLNAPNGKKYKYAAHISDYKRVEILLRYGGIYLDADVLVVKSFTPLRQYSVVMGREASDGLCNGIIVARRGALFLRLILEQYRSYLGEAEVWAVKSVINTDRLARLYPHLIHVEETSLHRPNWIERAVIYDGLHNWSKNYAVHLWVRLWPPHKRPNGIKDILMQNTTLGEMSRFIIYGSYKIRNTNSTV